jgi:pre-mRNA-processing factor 39
MDAFGGNDEESIELRKLVAEVVRDLRNYHSEYALIRR